jgi:inner membrane protein
MMSVTHAAISVAATSIALGTGHPWVLVTAAVGSQLPDLDTTKSIMGRILYPIASFIEARYPHRTITHSLMSTGAVAVLGIPLWLWLGWQYWAALVLGQFMGWFSDAFTKSGVAAFFPNPARLVIPGNPKARLESHAPGEYWVLAVAVLATVISVNLMGNGGLSESFARSFFNDSATAAQMFHKYGSTQQVIVEVRGLNVRTSQAVSERFTVIEATDSDVIAEEQTTGKLFKIGTAPDVQIQPTGVKTRLGRAIVVQAQEVNLSEVAIGEWLKTLPQNSYISGSLLLDDMAEVRLSLEVSSFPVMRVFGGQIELNNVRPTQLMSLRESWILQGRVIVKVRQ